MSNFLKDIEIKEDDPKFSIGDAIVKLQSETPGLDKIRSVLALRMNQYSNIILDKDEVKHIAKSFLDIEAGSSTNLVMICDKHDCLYQNRCALFKYDKCPEGYECLHENKVLTHAMNMYLESLEIDINNYPEMVLINQLVEYELIEYRCNAILSNYHKDLKMETVVGVDEQGRVVTKEEVSHALSIKMQVYKNKMQILQEFTATRREKYKKSAALKESKEGAAKMLSSIKAKIKQIKNKEVNIDEVHAELNALQDEDILSEEY
jgi:hypothetical protein